MIFPGFVLGTHGVRIGGGILERRASSSPFIHLLARGGRRTIEGEPSITLGHKLEAATGDVPDGVFAEWSWRSGSLKIRNDRYGFHPLYYFTRPGEICLSPSIPELIRHGAPAELDDDALATSLRLGFFIGDDTPFKEIRAIPPSATLEWDGDGLRGRSGYAVGPPRSISRDDAIDAYIATFRSALERRLPADDDFAVPISGGRDSRHILLELLRAGYRPKLTVTVPRFAPYPSIDIELASEVTSALRLDHAVLGQARSRLAAELTKNLLTSFCAPEDHAWCLPIVRFLAGRVHTVFDGIGGDVLSTSRYLTADALALFRREEFRTLAQNLAAPRDGILLRVLEAEAYRRFDREVGTERIARELEKHADAPNPVGSFRFWNIVRRTISLAPFGMINAVGEVYAPYLDHEVYDLLSSLPANILMDHQFHEDAVRRAFPRLAHIAFEPSDAEPSVDTRFFRRLAFEHGAYAASHKSRLVRQSYVVPRLMRRILDPEIRNMKMVAHPLVAYLIQLESGIKALVRESRSCSLRSEG